MTVLSHRSLLLGSLLPEGHVWARIEGSKTTDSYSMLPRSCLQNINIFTISFFWGSIPSFGSHCLSIGTQCQCSKGKTKKNILTLAEARLVWKKRKLYIESLKYLPTLRSIKSNHNDVCVSLRHNTLSPSILAQTCPLQSGGSGGGGSRESKLSLFLYYGACAL